MKQKTIYAILAVFILAAGLSGCLGNNGGNPNDAGNQNYDRDEADIRSVTITVNGSDVIATIVTDLDFDEQLDTANIKVSKIGNVIRAALYSIEPAAVSGTDTVDVKVGAVNELNDGSDYTFIINDENDRDERIVFRFENNALVVFKRAFVQNVTFEANGSELYAVAEITRAGAGDAVDTQNITQTRFDNENEMDIYIPLKIISAAGTNNETLSARISLGPQNQLLDGRYSVEINDREAYFTIMNGVLFV
ncbi:MAG: hypothetical protein LBU81_06760 [Methanosarcinales archaeon]|jgi:hypothetical protein|nr:hypothetical protein [Methanosarcinales archaeon]